MKWIYIIISFWLVFVLSLTVWWIYFGMTNLSGGLGAGDFERHQRMLFMEGTVLVGFLLIGGLSLFYFADRMYREKAAKEIFFASFTHDMKTALFRLQLELEKLTKRNPEVTTEPLFVQTRKMQLDLENSLDSSIGLSKPLYLQELNLKDVVINLHAQWPEFHIQLSGLDTLYADRKALDSVLKNLLQNSFVHGQADEVFIHVDRKNEKVQIQYRDNGLSFSGDLKQIGELKKNLRQGSGLGLYIVRKWVRRMGGQIHFLKTEKGRLAVDIELRSPA